MEEITCLQCGENFFVTKTRKKQGAKFCSRQCSAIFTRKKVNINCQWCGEKFGIIPSDATYNRGKFCSRVCATQSKRKGKMSKCHNTKRLKEIYIEPKRLRLYKIYFCSNKCMRETMRGELCWKWRNGATELHKKIRDNVNYKIWRKQIFERDKYVCQHCQKDIDNGITLCIECHKKTDSWNPNHRKHVLDKIEFLQISKHYQEIYPEEGKQNE